MSAQGLRDAQLGMAAYLRDPSNTPAPAGVEERRLKIYRDLIYNNIEGFISGGFPVLRSLYDDHQWEELVRSFMDGHRCKSPYFLEISQEFINFLMSEHATRDCDPPFLAELAHYEWVELALDVAEEELSPQQEIQDLEQTKLCLSSLAWVLSYQFPVHQIGANFRPETAEAPTFLVVYRGYDDKVGFIALNAATARLLEMLRGNEDLTAEEVLQSLAAEMEMSFESIREFGLGQLQELLIQGVLEAV
ncbi:MAG: putative DNA-binding domain-containing protein [Halioglobus sp.]